MSSVNPNLLSGVVNLLVTNRSQTQSDGIVCPKYFVITDCTLH
jgi:hypothetical protein